MDMVWQFSGSVCIGLSVLNVHLAFRGKGGLLNAFAAGFTFAIGFMFLQKSLLL